MVALRASQVKAEDLSAVKPRGAWAAQAWPEQEQCLLLPTDALSYTRAMPEPVRVEVPLWTSWPLGNLTALRGQSPAKVISSGASAKIMRTEEQGAGDIAPYTAAPLPEAEHLFPPGLAALPGTPSRGSAEHASGGCRPCAWVWKAGGCQSGHLCIYCHLCPEGELKSRKKSKLVMMRLGLDTPKASSGGSSKAADMLTAPGFCLGDVSRGEGSEAETTTASGSDRGVPSPSPTELLLSPPGCFLLPVAPMGPVPNVWPASPSPPRVGTPSEGSALHGSGVCRPCAWYWKPSGCQKESRCRFCHMCPEGEVKDRKKKKVATLRIESATAKSAATSEGETRFALNLANCL